VRECFVPHGAVANVIKAKSRLKYRATLLDSDYFAASKNLVAQVDAHFYIGVATHLSSLQIGVRDE
jgi:hypothetical protein